MNTFSRTFLVSGTLALLGFGSIAHSQTLATYFPTDTTIASSIPLASVVGYANGTDLLASKNGTSPTVNLVPGGNLGVGLTVYNSSLVNVIGGGISSSLSAFDHSTINLNAGTISGTVSAKNNSTINITGGKYLVGFYALNTSTVNLFGTGLSQTLVIGVLDLKTYRLSGKLLDGTDLTGKTLIIQNGAKVTLTSVPEPGSLALCFGMAGVGVFVRRRKH